MGESLLSCIWKRNLWLAIFYVLIACVPAVLTVTFTQASVRDLERAYSLDNLQNVGAEQVRPILGLVFENIKRDHRFLWPIITRPILTATATYLRQNLGLPRSQEAEQDLNQIPALLQRTRTEATAARRWSLALWTLSGLYLALVLWINKGKARTPVALALTVLSLICFSVGITAPALLILVVSPKFNQLPSCVLKSEVRSVLGVINALYCSGHWAVAGFLSLFSVVIPITKAALTLYALVTKSPSTRSHISRFLHAIGKWSMADVFVAAIFLACFAFRAQAESQAVLIRGFYYFLTYCLLSLAAGTALEYQKK